MHRRFPLSIALPALFLAAAGLLGLSLASGSVQLSLADVVSALGSGTPTLARDIVLELRLPRALAAFAVGGLLALSDRRYRVTARREATVPAGAGPAAAS